MIKRCLKCNFETTEIEKYFYKHKRSKDGFKYMCKKCQERSNNVYLNTEHGFMMNLYNSIKKKVNGRRYKHSSEEQKDKNKNFGFSNKGKIKSNEHKQKISKSLKGRTPNFLGKNHTNETKLKIHRQFVHTFH